MSAREYRARADALVVIADAAASYGRILEVEAFAREWRQLAQMADWQDALTAALAAWELDALPATPPTS